MEEDDPDIDPFARGLQAVIASRNLKPAPLSVQAGLSDSAIRDMVRKGGSPKLSTAQAIANVLGMTIDDIIAAGGGPTRVSSLPAIPTGTDLVPIYGVHASAGYGALVHDEEIVDTLAFPPGYLRRLTKANPRDLAIIGVKGESMVPTLQDDDIVMIDLTKRDLSYDGLFVIRDNGDGLLVKRIGRASMRGHVTLISDNRHYPPTEKLAAEIEVIGRVIWMGKKV